MKIETKFDIGDSVYCVWRQYKTDKWRVVGPLNIVTIDLHVTAGAVDDHFENYWFFCFDLTEPLLIDVDDIYIGRADAEKDAKERNLKLNQESWR